LERYRQPLSQMVLAAHAFIDTTELVGIFETGAPERTVLWQERDLWYRCRPDLLSADKRIVMDYKTTENASPEAFSKQIARMQYDVQSEFYTRGVFAVTEVEPTFIFLAQEIKAPFSCSLVALSNAYREVGRAKVSRAMKIWETCVRANSWPSYPNQICYAEPNAYQLADIEDEPKTEEDTE
jgi:hypothetical protein